MHPPLGGEEIETKSYTAPPQGVPIPQTAQARPEGLGCIRRYVGRSLKCNHTRPPPRAVPIPQTAQAGREGPACIRRSVGRSWKSNHTPSPPRGVHVPKTAKAGPEALGCIRCCAGKSWNVIVLGSPTGRHYPPNGPGTPEGRACVGRSWKPNHTRTPSDVPIPKLPGQDHRTRMYLPRCGEDLEVPSHATPPTGPPHPPNRPRHDRRDAGVSAAVWGAARNPIVHGTPYPPNRPDRTGVTHAFIAAVWGGVGSSITPNPPTEHSYGPNAPCMTGGTLRYPPLCQEALETQLYSAAPRVVPIRQMARGDRRDCGVSATVLTETGNPIVHSTPKGRPCHPNSPGRTRGTRMYLPLCGEDLDVPSYTTPPTGRPYAPKCPGRTGGTRVCPPLCGMKLQTQSYSAVPRGVPVPRTP